MSRHEKFSSIGRELNSELNMGFTYKTTRKINSIAIHCSASPQGRGDDAHTIDRWHLERFGANSGLGYHYVILEDGTIQKGRWADKQGAGVYGSNYGTLHICYIGGIIFEDITDKQKKSLLLLSGILLKMYDLDKRSLKGHNEYPSHSSRGCPMIGMPKLLELLD